MGLRGPKKGAVYAKTLAKQRAIERADEIARDIVLREWGPIITAQAEHAKGVSYMILRNADGTYTRATDERQIDAACAIGASAFKIFTQSPNTQAFVALSDRAFDKPTERPLEVTITGSIELVATRLIEARRARLLAAHPEPSTSDDESSE